MGKTPEHQHKAISEAGRQARIEFTNDVLKEGRLAPYHRIKDYLIESKIRIFGSTDLPRKIGTLVRKRLRLSYPDTNNLAQVQQELEAELKVFLKSSPESTVRFEEIVARINELMPESLRLK